MKQNMGALDRLLRAVVVAPSAAAGAVLVGLPSVLGIVLLGVATMALVSATTGVCLLYLPFGIDTHGGIKRLPRAA
jgi:hypothetical protein